MKNTFLRFNQTCFGKLIAFPLLFSVVLLSACANNVDPYTAFDRGDYETAKRLFKPSVENGDLQAMTFLAAIYQIERNFDDAIELYKQAAQHNYAPAQYNLGILLHEGKFAAKETQQAYGWFHLASMQGHSKAEDQLHLMMSELTPNQTMQAKTWVEAQLSN